MQRGKVWLDDVGNDVTRIRMTSLGAWSLVGCTVSPAFEFEGFELAPTEWEPG